MTSARGPSAVDITSHGLWTSSHFWLGSQLAKAGPRNLFRELLTRLTSIESRQPDLLYSNFVPGVKRLPTVVR